MKRMMKQLCLVMVVAGLMTGIFPQMVNAAGTKLDTPEITLSNVASSGKIKIKWKPVENAVSYQIYRSKDGEKWGRINTVKGTSTVNKNAVAGVKYYYKVRAIAADSANNSAFSKVKYRTCDLERPVITISTNKTSGKTVISWDKIENAVSYKVYSSTDKEKWDFIKTVKGKSITHSDADEGKLYYYRVKAIASNTAANSAFSVIKNGPGKYQIEVAELAEKIATKWKTKYVQGETGAKNSNGEYQFDCSGFATYVINKVMVKDIPAFRMTSNLKKLYAMDAVYNEGYPGEFKAKTIKLKDIQPGDVIFFSHHKENDHCGIYIGNNKFAHCTKSKGGAVVDSLTGVYERDFSTVRRYIPTEVKPANTKKTIEKYCSLYSKRGNDDSKIASLSPGTKVTVLFTGNSPESYNQAYIKLSDGTKGFIYAKNLK